MLTLTPGLAILAVAGLVAALGPLVIHLLNRRRFRVLEWAAMDFLLSAIIRNRKLAELRDLVLLLLRTLAVLLFGVALARPFFTDGSYLATFWLVGLGLALLVMVGAVFWATQNSDLSVRLGSWTLAAAAALFLLLGLWNLAQLRQTTGSGISSTQPVHAILLVDNSLTMGYMESTGKTVLDAVKSKTAEFIDRLPNESRITVLPLCGGLTSQYMQAWQSREDALEALRGLEPLDLKVSATEVADLATQARELVPTLPKRVVLLGDQQAVNWPADSQKLFAGLADMQVVSFAPRGVENSWVADFRLRDGLADGEHPTELLATLRHEGLDERRNVEVVLSINDRAVESQKVDLQPGQAREITFRHQFPRPSVPGKVEQVRAKVSLAEDRLPADDSRYLVVPVASQVPLVFIDQLGPEQEDRRRGLYGETWPLRVLLSPITDRTASPQQQLIQIRHASVRNLLEQRQALLREARMVVIAGVNLPGSIVPLLREYVEQGGQLILAGGAEFDPAEWHRTAWLDGRGILPLPLESEPFGKEPSQTVGQLHPIQLDFESMKNEYFLVKGEDEKEQAMRFVPLLFFKTLKADGSEEQLVRMADLERKRIEERIEDMDREAKEAEEEKRGNKPREQSARKVKPKPHRWLAWEFDRAADPWASLPTKEDERGRFVEQRVREGRPRVLARFTNGLPFLVDRPVERGRILLATSGLQSDWSTLARVDPIYVFDRIIRMMLSSTMPTTSGETQARLIVPLDPAERRHRYSLNAPGRTEAETLHAEALGADSYGLILRDVYRRGFYSVTAQRVDGSADERPSLWEMPIEVNGPEAESNPLYLDEPGLEKRLKDVKFTWLERDQEISLEGGQKRAGHLWYWLILAVGACLLTEMVVVAWPSLTAWK